MHPTGSPLVCALDRSRHEQVVREQLERKQVEAFLPTVTRWSRWKDRKKKIDWPLFPGYCFARFNPRERLPILKCTGVVNIVSFEGEPAPIPEHEIDGIRQLVESELAYDPCPMIREGHDGRGHARTAERASIGRLHAQEAPTRGSCCRST